MTAKWIHTLTIQSRFRRTSRDTQTETQWNTITIDQQQQA